MLRQCLADFWRDVQYKLWRRWGLLVIVVVMVLPRTAALSVLIPLLGVVAVFEFLRVRRPEINARVQARWGGFYSSDEVVEPSGFFWMLLGPTVALTVFTSRDIVLSALGFLVWGDSAGRIIGQCWGKRPLPGRPGHTLEAGIGFAVLSAVWASLFLRWPVAVVGGIIGAWLNTLSLGIHREFWLPVLGGLLWSLVNLGMGGR